MSVDLSPYEIVDGTHMPLWEHQKKAIIKAIEKDFRYGFFMEPGTGKTRAAITALRICFGIYGRPLKTLIITPKITLGNWKEELEKFSKFGKHCAVVDGYSKKKKQEVLADESKFVHIINPESIDSDGLLIDKKKRGSNYVSVPKDNGYEFWIIDESHRFKNPLSKRFKVAQKLRKGLKHCLILTGTPTTGNPMDFWSQFFLMDQGQILGDNFYAYRARYFIDANQGKPKHMYFPDWKFRKDEIHNLSDLIALGSISVLKEECLDLPPFVEKRVTFAPTPEQKRMATEIKKHLVTFKKSVSGDNKPVSVDIVLTAILRALQILCGIVVYDEGETKMIETPRYEITCELVEEHLQASPVIVWATFVPAIKKLEKMFTERGWKVEKIVGGQKQSDRDETIKRFQDGQIDVLLANPSAGGIGINLIQAKTAIWFNCGYDLEKRIQATARNYRGGSEMHDSVLSIDVVCDDKLEERIYKSLSDKKSLSDELLNNRNEFLGGLL